MFELGVIQSAERVTVLSACEQVRTFRHRWMIVCGYQVVHVWVFAVGEGRAPAWGRRAWGRCVCGCVCGEEGEGRCSKATPSGHHASGGLLG